MKPQRVVGWMFLAAVSSAAAAPTTRPLTPIREIPVPPPRAVEKTAAAPTPPSKIAILAFQNLGDAAQSAWVGRAFQESLAVDVARMGGLYPIEMPDSPAATDSAAVRSAAKGFGADTVVFGSYHFSEGSVRVTAQVVDVATGRALGGLKTGGDFRDLFALEDDLARQARRVLRPPAPSLADAAAEAARDESIIFGPQAAGGYDSGPSDYNGRFSDAYNRYAYHNAATDYPAAGYGYPSYGYDGGFSPYLYGGYSYGYGWAGPQVVVVNRGGRHHLTPMPGPVIHGPIVSPTPRPPPGGYMPFGGGGTTYFPGGGRSGRR